uniref:Peptidase_S9 domain-containing protein n=1 Tax=Syphacia muris TaxID=451379 RepID=A0A158R5I4_9BILA
MSNLDEEEAGPSKSDKKQLFTKNVSSLIDLKGELYRKKQESRIKDEFLPKAKKNILFVTKDEGRKRAEITKKRQERIAYLEKQLREEEEAERRRKKILEEKSEAYTKLSSGQILTHEHGEQVEFLVDFDAKRRAIEHEEAVEAEIERVEAETNDNVHFVPNEEKRVYGVSHVTFSQSETKRREQMKELMDLTKKTDIERQTKKEIRAKQEKEKLERINRIRKRKGLPELVQEVSTEDEEPTYLDIPLPPSEPEEWQKKKKLGIREWDRGKVGYMKWIEARREERNEEFQPPSSFIDALNLSLQRVMPPHVNRFSVSEKSWNALKQHAHRWKDISRCGLGMTLHHFYIYTDKCGSERILALGGSGQCLEQTIFTASLTREPLSEVTQLVLSSYSLGRSLPKGPPPAEFAALCERQRTSIALGICSYRFHSLSHWLLYFDSARLFLSKGETSYQVGEGVKGCPLNAEMCPCDPNLVAFVANRNIYIDYNGKIIYHTTAGVDITNGCSSYIMQEELNRFTGLWWCPSKERVLLYEQVDETEVSEVQFSCPGQSPSAVMKYPLTGTANAKSTLRIITINGSGENFQVTDKGLAIDLHKQFPWYEYLARVGWLPNGSAIWALLLNRLQDQYALILIKMDFFSEKELELNRKVTVLLERKVSGWYDVDSLTYFFVPENGQISFIHTSSMSDNTHLSYYTLQIDEGIEQKVISTTEKVITRGDWCVFKDAGLHVDPVRNHVYFVSNKNHPTESNLCVTSYKHECEPEILTEIGLSYRVERTECEIQLNENIGFVCWESSLTVLPRCSFYRILHVAGCNLPRVIRQYVIQIPNSGLLNEGSVFTGRSFFHDFWNLIFCVKYILICLGKNCYPVIMEYNSMNSGRKHYGILLRPLNYVPGTCYPVIQVVYGGPGVQLVRNCWSGWANYLKFTSLGYVVVMVDGRGSANRGSSFESVLNKKLAKMTSLQGTFEIDDQVEGLLQISKMSGDLLDLDRVGVMGWSYGGYVSLLALAKYPGVYRAAVVGGAVTCWELYDTAYTERYLGMPSDSVYKKASVLNYVKDLPDEENRLLIVHGMIDENVHFTHTEKLIEALIAAGKPYNLQVFPSERHGVRSAEASDFHDAITLSFFQKALSNRV